MEIKYLICQNILKKIIAINQSNSTSQEILNLFDEMKFILQKDYFLITTKYLIKEMILTKKFEILNLLYLIYSNQKVKQKIKIEIFEFHKIDSFIKNEKFLSFWERLKYENLFLIYFDVQNMYFFESGKKIGNLELELENLMGNG